MHFDAACVSTRRTPATLKRIDLHPMDLEWRVRRGRLACGWDCINFTRASTTTPMKVLRIQNHAIRIEIEDANDWRLFTRMLMDAGDENYDPAADATVHMHDDETTEDWLEFVVPDLREQFDASLLRVSKMIEKARKAQSGGKGGFLIPRDAAEDWYGTLNRARLALELKHRLAAPTNNPSASSNLMAARRRERFYCVLQCLILEHAFR